MARWRLTASHYLHTEDQTKWEYSEVDRTTGRPKRTQFPVPTFLDINDPACWTEKMLGMDGKPVEGYINVCNGTGAERGDVIFKGDPTPDMMPLDDEAEVISRKFRTKWDFPEGSEPGTFAQNLVDNFQKQLAEVQANIKPQPTEIAGMAEFMTTMTAVMEQNAKLMASLAGKRA